MENSLLEILFRLTLGGSAAIVLILLLRRPLRRLAGATVAYHAWLLLPAALLACALPSMHVAPQFVLAAAPAVQAGSSLAQAVPVAAGSVDWITPVWLGGALATLALLILNQRAFNRTLGSLTRSDGFFTATSNQHGPVLLGLWRPVVVVPSDFAMRYSPDEQALVLAHERMHALRRDPAANAVLASLQCIFWFNPLMHLAVSRCRFDQELACDADVMAGYASQRQAYASAMLKTQTSGAPALATCHWQSTHPLKERIMNLKHTAHSSTRRHAGRIAIALVAAAGMLGTVAVRADTAAKAEMYELSVKFEEGEGNSERAIPVKAGQDIALNWKQAGAVGWNGVFRVEPASGQAVFVRMKVTQDDGQVITPSLMLKLGERGAVKVTDQDGTPTFSVGLTVNRAVATN